MRGLSLTLSLALGACVTAQPAQVATISQLTSNLAAFDGQVVLVHGWLDECEDLSCGLFASKSEAEERQYGPQMLSIGSTVSFDDKAVGKGPAEVLLKARVDATCRREDIVCMDRASELRPISIRFLGKR